MKHFITRIKSVRLWAIVFWLLVWQLAAMAVGQKILLVSPLETLARLLVLLPTGSFWRSALFSLTRILCGFLAASFCGIMTAALGMRFPAIDHLFAPLLTAIRAVPVASFVIVALIWVPSRNLSILISFLIALPVVHAGALSGIRQMHPELLEMADVFRISFPRRLLFLWLPATLPALSSALHVAMGLSWKSGVAAEVIGIPSGSIGEALYRAKIYLATPDLFAWTLTIVALSSLCEHGLAFLLRRLQHRLERM